jgi:hypothetical protein
MNFRTTAVLAFLCAVALLTVIFVALRPPPKTATLEPLLGIDFADVETLTLTSRAGDKLVVRKNGMEWDLVEPVAARADRWAVESLVRAVTEVKPGIPAGSDLKPLGLDPPMWTVEVKSADKTATLLVGPRPTVGENINVALKGVKDAWRVKDTMGDALAKRPDSYRSRQLVTANSIDINQITLKPAEGPELVLQRTAGQWEMMAPERMPADGGAVSDLTFALTGLNAVQFVDVEDIPTLGNPAARPRSSVWFSTEAPSTQPTTTRPAGTTVSFGGFDSVLKKNVYAYVDAGKTFAVVAATEVDRFAKKPLDLRDKKLLDIDPAKVTRLAIARLRPATTQPTTREAETQEIVIERRKQEVVLGPPTPVELPATQPTTQPDGMPTTEPATQPTTAPATQPALPVSDWLIKTQNDAEAGNAKVQGVLFKFNPLRVDKYLEPSKATTQPTATWTIRITTESGGTTTTHEISLVDPGDNKPLIGAYMDLRFEIYRGFVDGLLEGYENKPLEPAMPEFDFPGFGGRGGMGGMPDPHDH